jgi:F1F0 ATPase subunit 2
MNLLLGFIAGVAVGLVHFTALRWSIRVALSHRRPALWMVGVGFVRLAVTVAMLAFVAGYGIGAFLSALVGLWLVRTIMILAQRELRHAHA